VIIIDYIGVVILIIGGFALLAGALADSWFIFMQSGFLMLGGIGLMVIGEGQRRKAPWRL
jgi:hypothetical protein